MDSLKDIKPGDLVTIDQGYDAPRLARVDRLTATQIIVGNERFRISDGEAIGGSRERFRRYFLRRATATDVLRARVSRANAKLKQITVTTDTLAAAEDLIAAATKTKKEDHD